MKTILTDVISVAGNTVIDIPLLSTEAPVSFDLEFTDNVSVVSQPVNLLLGGCGAAVAYVLGALGESVILNSNIGKDKWGQLATEWLDSVGVKIVANACQNTAVHVIMVDGVGRRQSHYYLGEKVRWEMSLKLDAPTIYYSSGYGAVDANDLYKMAHVFSKLKDRGTKVVFDVSPWFAGRVCKGSMEGVFKYVDYIVGTESELRMWKKGNTLQDLGESFLNAGAKYVVIKRGPQGAYGASQFGEMINAKVRSLSQRYTVGAGDSFNGRLLSGICRKEIFSDSVQNAANFATKIVNSARGALGATHIFTTGD